MSRRLPPFECELTHLGPKGVALGVAPDGTPVGVRGAPPGSRVAVTPMSRSKGRIAGRRTALIRPPAAYVPPPCPQFGLCGGCTLQELALSAQRAAKAAWAHSEVVSAGLPLTEVAVHPVRGTDAAYGYRNKVELSFGARRYVSEADMAAGVALDGLFLGFHAPGRFDRVVDAPTCGLMSAPMQAVLTSARASLLGCPAPRTAYDPKVHTGFLRHLVIREVDGACLAVLYTTTGTEEDAAAVHALSDDLGTLVAGFQWRINDGVADVARGDIQWQRGAERIVVALGHITLSLSALSFFQVNTAGARVLVDTIDGLLPGGGRLVDLYCGIGTIGLYLARRHDEVFGIEVVPDAIDDAITNAGRNGIPANFRAGKVEDLIASLAVEGAHVVVDPPRAGLHPSVALALARAPWQTLVYVACHPSSLGRDGAILAAHGATLRELHTVDLFPQTGHVELVARFSR